MNINTISLGKKYRNKSEMLNQLAKYWNPASEIERISPKFDSIENFKLREIDEKVKTGQNLTISEAFHGMCHVVAATNNFMPQYIFPNKDHSSGNLEEYIAKGTYFLTLMAFKEATYGLTPEEIAGITAAGMIDLVVYPFFPEITETAGMGGDRGWKTKTIKTINASTLSAIVTAACGHMTMKHGSYGNTTKIGSTDVPEMFGANIIQKSPLEIKRILKQVKFWFSDAHCVKTLHYISHRLMVETINHVVGPMTPPVNSNSTLYKVMGVNHNVHPKIIAKAYDILNKMGIIKLGAVVAIGGVDEYPSDDQVEDEAWFKDHCFLDEIAPQATIVSISSEDGILETTVLNPTRDLGHVIREENIKIPNEKEALLEADKEALTGGELGKYLACNAALALWTHHIHKKETLNGLKYCVQEAMEAITSGKALDTLNKYIEVSGGKKVCT